MYEKLSSDLNGLDHLLELTKNKAVKYLSDLPGRPVSIPPDTNISVINLPAEGLGTEAVLDAFYTQHEAKIVAASGPRYWGYVVGGTTPAAIAGDWLATVFDQNPQGIKHGGDISALIEHQTIKWLLELFNLPEVFRGGFVSGATMSNFTCLAVARQWAGSRRQNDVAREGIRTEIRVLTATPHSSSIKSLSMLGMGSSNVIPIKTAEGNREAIDLTDLENKLRENSTYPIILISSGGTVNTVDFDDMKAIATLQKTYSFYWHVDAAFGGFAACSDQTAHLLAGWQDADSITIDCHKWLNVPYDSALYLINQKHAALQLQTFQNSNAPYLGDPASEFNYLNAVPENSRRFRALPAWFSLYAYGKAGYQWIVENNVRLAKLFASLLEERTIFRLAAPVRLNVVCFTTRDQPHSEEVLNNVFQNLNESGKVFMTLTNYKGMFCMRAAFVNWRTSDADVDVAINELIEATKEQL